MIDQFKFMKSQRILSIDIFRGLTIFLMVFVNELAGVTNIPDWMKHRSADFDGMTFVDVVFPAFLFIVGMAIPFAVKNRENKGDSPFQFWKHAIIRTIGLLVLGVFMVNSAEMNKEANLISFGVWTASFYIAAVLIWNRYPAGFQKEKPWLVFGLKVLGILVLVGLSFLFRKGETGALTGMTPSWWGILGLIGWAYIISLVLFFLTAKHKYALGTVFIGLLILVLGLKGGWNIIPFNIDWLKGQSGHIAHSLLTISGILASLLLRTDGIDTKLSKKIVSIIILGLFLAVAAYFIRPHFGGISKIYATPAWALYCAAICCFVFPLVFWIVDVKGQKTWANFLTPAGQNPLLTYILPPFIFAVAGYGIIPAWVKDGIIGIFWSVIFSLLILWIAKLLTRLGVRLHL
jgi:heparan-alpha-glucosaminide N-acetyltransferase